MDLDNLWNLQKDEGDCAHYKLSGGSHKFPKKE
jgi:hypothetical protein